MLIPSRKRKPHDPRIQRLFEKMADECDGTLKFLGWRKWNIGREGIFSFEGKKQRTRFSLLFVPIIKSPGDEIDLVQIERFGLSPAGRWIPEKQTRVLVSPLPFAVLAVALR